VSVNQPSVADRMALQDLVAAYARGVDRRVFQSVAALFTEDGRLAIYNGQPGTEPPQRERLGREQIARAMTRLEQYDVTTHILGQQSVAVDGDTATGETYCLAHHFSDVDGRRTNMVMSIRYLDTFVRLGNRWFIEERLLAVDWVEHRPVT
jgi:hypothetical protein